MQYARLSMRDSSSLVISIVIGSFACFLLHTSKCRLFPVRYCRGQHKDVAPQTCGPPFPWPGPPVWKGNGTCMEQIGAPTRFCYYASQGVSETKTVPAMRRIYTPQATADIAHRKRSNMSENRRRKAKGGASSTYLARGCAAQKLHVTAAWPINGVTNDLSLGIPRMQDTGAGAKKKRKEEATRAETLWRSGSCSSCPFARPTDEATERAPLGTACELRPPSISLSMRSLPHVGLLLLMLARSCQALLGALLHEHAHDVHEEMSDGNIKTLFFLILFQDGGNPSVVRHETMPIGSNCHRLLTHTHETFEGASHRYFNRKRQTESGPTDSYVTPW
jgi:hypothetical protein